MATIELPPRDPRVASLLGEFPEELFDDRFYRSWELVNRYGLEWAVRLGAELELLEALDPPASLDEISARRGFQPGFRRALHWLLQCLAELGVVEAVTADGVERWEVAGSLPPHRLSELSAACLEADPANAASIELLDAAGAVYPQVATGRTSGQEALFGLGQTRLWLSYFHNDNPTYAINNRLAAIAAANRLEPGAFSVLEVGGGAGSGTEALLAELAARGRLGDVARYSFTEPSPFFRRRAERQLRSTYPDVRFEFAAVDIDEPLAGQGVEEASYDLVVAINVLHVAHDLRFALRQARESLVRGGWLVAAEAIRPRPGGPISTEFVFQLLDDFVGVDLHPELRPNPGFLTAGQWRQLLADAGFTTVDVLPDHDRISEIYPRFFTGVVCGRGEPG